MKSIEKTTEFELTEDTAVAIGKVRRFSYGTSEAFCIWSQNRKRRGLAAAVFTFVPSPAAFFQQRSTAGADHDSGRKGIFLKKQVWTI